MKFLLQLLLIIGLGFLAQLFFPFWALVLAAFVVVMLLGYNKPFLPFLGGLLAGAILWGGMAWYQNMPNDGVLAERISTLMGFGGIGALLGITALLGGLLAALGSLSGFYFRQLFRPSAKAAK
ncbi:MAG: hypothetical protein GYB31_10605 [Bacteroidetes bacterium]|nr:hypothetical protein [Bacteroidota bacterium]